MPIKGLTDQPKEFNPLGRIEVSVFKGARKGEKKAGADLNHLLRISTTNEVARTILKAYGEPDRNGDILTPAIALYLPFDEVERTFKTSMKAHTTSGLELVCDRHTISKKCIPQKDAKGNIWRPLVDVEEPCPMRDKGFVGDCPKGCVKEGQLDFYIRELLDHDLMWAGRITVHGFADITYLSTKLEEIKQILGSLTTSPFPAHQYRHKIPFILSRVQVPIKRPLVDEVKVEGSYKKEYIRTGKKTNGTTWALSLQVDPHWMQLYRRWQFLEEMAHRQLPVSSNAVVGLLTGDVTVIDAEIVQATKPDLPSRADRMRERIKQLTRVYEDITGVSYEVKDLYDMDEEALEAYGKELKATVDKLREADD